jgi:hypothetical protein
MVSPFVIVNFVDKAQEIFQITVGNESAPSYGHEAVVKSFDFGGSDGLNVDVEILDEQGGAFSLFTDHLVKCLTKRNNDIQMQVQWGWSVSNCDGSFARVSSPRVFCIPLNMEINFEGGKVKYKVTAKDYMNLIFGEREDKVFGVDDGKMKLAEAVKKMFQADEPSMQVFFKGDPKSVWAGENQHRLGAAQKWIENFVTENDQGSVPAYDYTSQDPTVIWWEGVKKKNCEPTTECNNSIGTFIVNGGNCSNVISFQPNLNWPAALLSAGRGGNSGSAASGQAIKKKPPCPLFGSVGIAQNIPLSQPAWDVYGSKNAIWKSSAGQDANGAAAQDLLPHLAAIKAELKIQGDPRLCGALKMIDAHCSVVVINPFHLKGGGDSCGDWIASPGCNAILSNKNWRIMGVAHSMREGSYTTTLSLALETPGKDLVSGTPLGGDGTYVPPHTC